MRIFRALIVGNLNLAVFLVGFTIFSVALSRYSVPLAGVVGGLILMLIAAFPFLMARKG